MAAKDLVVTRIDSFYTRDGVFGQPPGGLGWVGLGSVESRVSTMPFPIPTTFVGFRVAVPGIKAVEDVLCRFDVPVHGYEFSAIKL